jgi:hypothetical protein
VSLLAGNAVALCSFRPAVWSNRKCSAHRSVQTSEYRSKTVQDEHFRLRLSYLDKSLRTVARAVILDAIAVYAIVAVLGSLRRSYVLPRRRGVHRKREAALLIWQTVLCNGSAATGPRCSRRCARMSRRSALDDCSTARCRATETSLVQSQHPWRKGLAAALARLKKIWREAPRRTAVQCSSPAGDRNTRGAVRATKKTAPVRVPLSHWGHGSACRRLGSHDCLAQCALPLGDGNIRTAVRATETSAMQSGHPSLLQTGGSPDGTQSFWPCPFRKNEDARTALRRSRSPGLHCGGFGRPDCVADVSAAQRQSALRQAVVGAQMAAGAAMRPMGEGHPDCTAVFWSPGLRHGCFGGPPVNRTALQFAWALLCRFVSVWQELPRAP